MSKNNSTYMTCSKACWAKKWIFRDNLPGDTYEIITWWISFILKHSSSYSGIECSPGSLSHLLFGQTQMDIWSVVSWKWKWVRQRGWVFFRLFNQLGNFNKNKIFRILRFIVCLICSRTWWWCSHASWCSRASWCSHASWWSRASWCSRR